MLLLLWTASCGETSESVVTPQQEPFQPAAGEATHLDYALSGINPLVSRSEAAILGTVVNTEPPRWNSDDDKAFDSDDTTEPIKAWRYRLATVHVDSALWSSESLPLVPGDDVRVFLFGDGSATGLRVLGPVYENNISGPVEPDARVLMLLGHFEPAFRTRDGGVRRERAVGLVVHFEGNWTIESGEAINILPERTVPLDALIDRLKRERLEGYDPQINRAS